VNHFRTFRNDDPPALAELWSKATAQMKNVRPLKAHEFDGFIAGKPGFDPKGFIIAEQEDKLVGFAHAGFGPVAPAGPSHAIDFSMGTIAMMILHPSLGPNPGEIASGLVRLAENHLRSQGAAVIYAGGQAPLNPFYWGLYGGSEFSGILSGHSDFARAVTREGYVVASRSILFEADLTQPLSFKDPRMVLMRRQTLLEIEEDAILPSWWDARAIGESHPTRYRLVRRGDNALLASAWTWEMTFFSVANPGPCLGLINVEVPAEHRRKGYGRHLVGEIMRRAKGEWVETLTVQTAATNTPAVRLYESLDFNPVDAADLFRKPGA
jgi:GNAT superfamily N-acetyltransferase